jgi:hypothetical protein
MMHPRRSRSVSATLLISILGSLLALGVALVLPALRTHHFGQLYKPIEVRQAAARHSVLDFEDSRGDVQVEPVSANPLPARLPVEDSAHPSGLRAAPVLAALLPPPTFMMRHLRLGGARSAPPDPLLV